MTPELAQWRSRAILSGIEKHYYIDYDNATLNNNEREVAQLPLPPVKTIMHSRLDLSKTGTLVIPDTVELLADTCFSFLDSDNKDNRKQIKNIKLSKNLRSIPKYIFKDTSIKDIFIPKSIGYIDDYSFKNCKYLKNMQFENIDTIIAIRAISDTPWFRDCINQIEKETEAYNISFGSLNEIIITINKKNCNGDIMDRVQFKISKDYWTLRGLDSIISITNEIKKNILIPRS